MALKLPTELNRFIEHAEFDANFRFLESRKKTELLSIPPAGMLLYVSPTGNNANDGLTQATPLASIAEAARMLTKYHHGNNIPTIRLLDGIYTEAVSLPQIYSYRQGVKARIVGNVDLPGNVVCQAASAQTVFSAELSKGWLLDSMTVGGGVTGIGLLAMRQACLYFQNLNFGVCSSTHMSAQYHSQIVALGNYKILGNALYHMYIALNGHFSGRNITVTFQGGITVSYFVIGNIRGLIDYSQTAFVGSLSGGKFYLENKSILYTAGLPSGSFPGNGNAGAQSGALYL